MIDQCQQDFIMGKCGFNALVGLPSLPKCLMHLLWCCLQLFLEGVDEKLKSGVKAEEVGYLLAFNKQELRKVIKEYPVKEVFIHSMSTNRMRK